MVLKRKSRALAFIVVLLLLCEAASLAVLFSRLSQYSIKEFHNIIPLTESKGNTVVTVLEQSEDMLSAPPQTESGLVLLAAPSFSAYDDHTVWQAETDVEIFRVAYENGENRITVTGQDGNGDKLIAPGTANRYEFTLANTGDVPLRYELSMESWVTGTELEIPVKASVRDYESNYLCGSPDSKAPVSALNNVKQDSTLGVGRYAVYALEWEWPFEQGDDEYDTMLGNLAVDDALSLHIRINTTASYSDSPEAEDSGIRPPKTGDDFNTVLYIVIMLAALLIFFSAFCLKDKKEKTEDAR